MTARLASLGLMNLAFVSLVSFVVTRWRSKFYAELTALTDGVDPSLCA